ncbi:MAG: DMP19 family protein [Chloroflexi bacterium]|nr:DMP19 family protein [Chloroflexota bacterium]
MTDRPFLDAYSGQSTDELIALDGTYRTDSIVLAFEQAIGQKAARIGDQRLTMAERVVLAVEALEREVNNDGYDGLFRNAPEHVPDLASALTAIGRDDVASLTRSAIDVLGVDDPLTPTAIHAAIEIDNDERDARLSELDETYYETAGDLAGPLIAFIVANSAEIELP